MKKLFLCAIALFYSSLGFAQFNYPKTPQRPVVDDYYGTKITDPYRWMEDLKSPEVETWIKDQAKYSESVLSQIPGRTGLFNDIKKLVNMKQHEYRNINQVGNTTFYTKREPDEKIAKLYCRKEPDGKEILLFAPQDYKSSGDYYIYGCTPSFDGSRVALGLTKGGAEIAEIRILDVASRRLLPDSIGPAFGGINDWSPDNKGVYYTKLNTTDITSDDLLKRMRVMLHELGTPTSEDKEIVSMQKYPELEILPEHFLFTIFSDDFRYVFLVLGGARKELILFYAPASEIRNEHIGWKTLCKLDDKIVDIILKGEKLYFLTSKGAPNFKMGLTDIRHPDLVNSKIIVAESKTKVITEFKGTKNFISYSLSDGISDEQYQINDRTGEIKKIPLPAGSSYTWALNRRQSDRLMAVHSDWITPMSIWDYDLSKTELKKSKWFDEGAFYPDYQKQFAVKETEVASYDGTMVPLSIVYPKNMKMDGSTPCYITGYGGYGIPSPPWFNSVNMALLQQGVVLAVAHVRGGGEKGEAWHQAGMKSTKMNTWKDFIACAEYLVKQKYTSPQKLIGEGMSMGGVLIGRAITERPDLFAVALVQVGCTNMLRMETTPNGPNQIIEVGTLKDSADTRYIIEMDAQSKVKTGEKYPAVLVRSGYNDPRVIPWMPAKFAAALQNSSASGRPVLLDVSYDNGHFTSDVDVICRDYSDMYSFALWQVGHPGFIAKK